MNGEVRLRIGVAGMGRMGAAMAGRLLALGWPVTVWNRTAAKAAPLAAQGARVAASAAALASETDVILTIVTGDEAVTALYERAQGLLAGDASGKLFVEMSTVRPHVKAAVAEAVAKRGAALVDCPVSGTVGPAREGRLIGFAGGAADDVSRARPVLEALCRRVEHVGPVGAGARMKLAVNLPLMIYWQALGEALALCAPLGLEPGRLFDILSDTSGAPNVLKVRAGALADALVGRTGGAVTFNVELIRKDLQSMLAEAASLGIDLPVSRQALACYDEAAREGLGEADCATLPARFARRIGRA